MPPLGSPRDKVFRKYLAREVRIEAKKLEMLLMNTIATPVNASAEGRKEWADHAYSIFDEFVALSVGLDAALPSEAKLKGEAMLSFYDKEVKNTKMVIRKTGNSSFEAIPIKKTDGSKEVPSVRKAEKASKIH